MCRCAFCGRLLAAVGLLFVLGCSSGDSNGNAGEPGTMMLELSSTLPNGVTYRLVNANLNITGQGVDLSISGDEGDIIEVDLDPEDYSLLLEDGWSMEREEPGGSIDAVEAVLVSENPQIFSIYSQTITDMALVFQVGDDVIPIGKGRARITITIQEQNDDPSLPPSCDPVSDGGSTVIGEIALLSTLSDSWHTGYRASPVVRDLDRDGVMEIIAARHGRLVVWHPDGGIAFYTETGDRTWASPVVADLVPLEFGDEIAIAAYGELHIVNASGQEVSGFPLTWSDELRSLAAADIDGDGELELVVATTRPVQSGDSQDVLMAYNTDGTVVEGFPPIGSGASGCDDRCYVAGAYDQNIALGDMDGDGVSDVLATHDTTYFSLHRGNGYAFDASDNFENPTKVGAVRSLLNYDLAKQGWTSDPDNDLQAFFTYSAPAIADMDGDGMNELLMLGSVGNVSQTNIEQGVALFVLENDGTRPASWVEPFHAPDYLAGLYSVEMMPPLVQQVTVANLRPDTVGLDAIFAGYDGYIHVVDNNGQEVWRWQYDNTGRVLTGGVAVADLSGDAIPEVVFATYSPDEGVSSLYILGADGRPLAQAALLGLGSVAVPTIADTNGDQQLEILVSLYDAVDNQQVMVFTVAGSSDNCLLWPTGRGNDLRTGYMPN